MATQQTLHIAMYPLSAMGHLTTFLRLSNKLAERGHRISFFIPAKTQAKLEPFNLHPHLITFIPITLTHVDGLPLGSETTADVPFPLFTLIMIPFPLFSPERKLLERQLTQSDYMEPPPNFPPSFIKLHAHEARSLATTTGDDQFGIGVTFHERLLISFSQSDAMGFKTCREMEGPYCDYLETQFKKPVILAGPVLPEPPNSVLEEKWAKYLENFEADTVIYCAFGSESTLKIDQFQELVSGLELTGLPFFAALKPPAGVDPIDSALPEGFKQRIQGKGVVYGGWVQQQLILGHPSMGCFVTHCGSGSLSEAMVNECQLVLLPHRRVQNIDERMMGRDLRVGVEVEKGEEDGLFTRDSVCKAIKSVMEEGSEVGREVRSNHGKWRALLLRQGFESSYIDGFVHKLHELLV